MSTAQDVLTAGGISNADALVRAANDTGLPLGVAAALIAKESYGQNIYGHDSGGALSGAGTVTQDNFTNQFMPLIKAGHTSNGVGPTQITYSGYFLNNPSLAWWDPYTNMCFGFNLMKGYLNGNYTDAALVAAGSTYNSGSATGSAATYGRTFADLAETWTQRLTGADDTPAQTTVQEDDMDANQAAMLQAIHDRVMGGLPNGAEPQNGAKILDSNDGGALMAAIQNVPKAILNYSLPRDGWNKGDAFYGTNTTLGAVVSWFDINVNSVVSIVTGKITDEVGKISTGGIDADQVRSIITTAFQSAFSTALTDAASGITATK